MILTTSAFCTNMVLSAAKLAVTSLEKKLHRKRLFPDLKVLCAA